MSSTMRLILYVLVISMFDQVQCYHIYSGSYFLVFFQIREPFSIMSIVKSPMGLMVGFMLVVVFIMPKLMENMGKYSVWFTSFSMFQISTMALRC